MILDQVFECAAVGSRETVTSGMSGCVATHRPDELMLTAQIASVMVSEPPQNDFEERSDPDGSPPLLTWLGPEDAGILAREFQPKFDVEDVLNLPNHSICLKLMISGTPSPPFSAEALNARTPARH